MQLCAPQDSGIPGHAQNTSGRTHCRSVFIRSQHPSKASLLQARPRGSPRTAGQYDAVCSRKKQRPQNKLLGLRQPALELSNKQAPAGEGSRWSKLYNTPFIGPKHRLCPSLTNRSLASPWTSISSTKGGDWKNCSKEERLGNTELSQVYVKLP